MNYRFLPSQLLASHENIEDSVITNREPIDYLIVSVGHDPHGNKTALKIVSVDSLDTRTILLERSIDTIFIRYTIYLFHRPYINPVRSIIGDFNLSRFISINSLILKDISYI